MEDKPKNAKKATGQDAEGKAPDFWFRLRIKLSPLQRLNSDETEIGFRLEEEGKDVRVKAAPRGPLKNAKTIDFDVHGFDSREEAHEVGLRLRKSVMLAAAVKAIGVDAGIDQTLADQDGQEQRAQGYRVEDEMRGLTVYEGELYGIIMSDAYIVHAPNPDEFFAEVRSKFSANPDVSDKQLLALELYGLSQFETSVRARFIVLTSVVEILADRQSRPEESRTVLSQLVVNVESSGLDSGQKSSLIAGIESLQNEAISKACRKLVNKYLGEKTVKEFNDIYDLRSKLLHEGDCKDGDIGGAELNLTHMVAAIFEKMIRHLDEPDQSDENLAK